MKQPSWLHWQPQYHWTDDKIRVHAFLCVLAVTVGHLLRREAEQKGIDLSLPQLLQDLTEVHEVLLAYPETSGTRDRLTLTTRTRRQQKLLDVFGVPAPMNKPVIYYTRDLRIPCAARDFPFCDRLTRKLPLAYGIAEVRQQGLQLG
ncbi:MAG: hypothetical protein C7B45_09805 [Sulfobacillus acidophilus]|uniref:Transposase n=1 Tax=Sulfobacillus acidophilus TaxID=53633 RepID=A0A2T2WHI6_9FIRM|nr:MAG: hypothetical protein C7B45_09805 [Sulfobacillus acidophilus]